MLGLKNILVPTDFSGSSEAAVAYGKELARDSHAELHVLHVIEHEPAFSWKLPASPAPPPFRFSDDGEPTIHARMEQVQSEAAQAQLQTRLAIRRGVPETEIVRYARAHGIDVIVLGPPGPGHLLASGVAEKVVRQAPCAVLTVSRTERKSATV